MTATLAPQFDQEREHLINQAIAIATAAREMAVTADLFSARIRSPKHSTTDNNLVEAHLAQVRRNCAEAQDRAEAAKQLLEDPEITWLQARRSDESLRDAQVHLMLADHAYDRACQVTP